MRLKFMLVFAAVLILSAASIPVEAANVESINDLKTAKVGVQTGTVSETLVRDLLKDSSGEVVAFENVFDVADALQAKKINAAVMD